MHRGKADVAAMHFDALQAFWPALQARRGRRGAAPPHSEHFPCIWQVLVGDIEQAAATHAAFHSLWARHHVLPERCRRRSSP